MPGSESADRRAQAPIDFTTLSQSEIYDQRYAASGYDHRSAVRVLSAEWSSLHAGVERFMHTHPEATAISILDFGYGTGRVTNEFLATYGVEYPSFPRRIHVVAYDVSLVGLKQAAARLCHGSGFQESSSFRVHHDGPAEHTRGTVQKTVRDHEIVVDFVCPKDGDSPENMKALVGQVNGGEKFCITTSWYSGLGHVQGQSLRRRFFDELARSTSDLGEMIISVASTGDLPDDQQLRRDEFTRGITPEFPIETSQDLTYVTELGQRNFWHVFGTDLNDHMAEISLAHQTWWIEAIRFPDEEFENAEQELANYARVTAFNRRQAGKPWGATDFSQCHTVAALLSGGRRRL